MDIPKYLKYLENNIATLDEAKQENLQTKIEDFINDLCDIHELSNLVEDNGLFSINVYERSVIINDIFHT